MNRYWHKADVSRLSSDVRFWGKADIANSRCHGGYQTEGDGVACYLMPVDEDLPPNIESPDYWRTRAEEARTISEQMHDSQTKALMLGIAETYERIAKAYETNALIDENPGTKRS